MVGKGVEGLLWPEGHCALAGVRFNLPSQPVKKLHWRNIQHAKSAEDIS